MKPLLKTLNKEQIQNVYNEHMVKDFPKDELKPLAMIYKALDSGLYECLGLFNNNDIIGYTFLIRIDNAYLVDYLATFPEIRNKGIGANMLELLDTYLASADRIIGEVEDPAYTNDLNKKELQTRRIDFYKRNGCRDTGLRVKCFGVPFIVLEKGAKPSANADEVWTLYQKFYKTILSAQMYEKNIKRL